MPGVVRQFRLVVWNMPRGKWCFDRDSVIEDAIDMGLARRSQRHRGTVFWDVMVEVRERQVEREAVIVKVGRAA